MEDLFNFSLLELKTLAGYYNIPLNQPIKDLIKDISENIFADKQIMRGEMLKLEDKEAVDRILKKPPKDCKITDPIDLGEFIAGGSYGRVYAACVKSDCDLVIKLQALEETEAFDREIQISKVASEKGFGPKVIYACIIEDGDDKLGLIVMERWQGTLYDMAYLWCDYWRFETPLWFGVQRLKPKEPRPTDPEMLKRNSETVERLLTNQVKMMHKAGYIHADLNPLNILVNTDKEVITNLTLTDFGFSFKVEKFMDKLPSKEKLLEFIDKKDVFGFYQSLKQKNVLSLAESIWLIFSTLLERWSPSQIGSNPPESLVAFKRVHFKRAFIVPATGEYQLESLMLFIDDLPEAKDDILNFINFLYQIHKSKDLLYALDDIMLDTARRCVKLAQQAPKFLERAKGVLFSDVPIALPKPFYRVSLEGATKFEYRKTKEGLEVKIQYKNKESRQIKISNRDFEQIYLRNWGLRWFDANNKTLQ